MSGGKDKNKSKCEDNISGWIGLELRKSQRSVENRKREEQNVVKKVMRGAPMTSLSLMMMMLMTMMMDGWQDK